MPTHRHTTTPIDYRRSVRITPPLSVDPGLTVKKVANTLTAASQGKLVENLISGYIIGEVTGAVAKAGIPLKSLDFGAQAEAALRDVLGQLDPDFKEHGLVIDPDAIVKKLYQHVEDLVLGKAVANGLPPRRNPLRVADPVILARDEFERDLVDFTLDGAGMSFSMRRTYRSGAAFAGDLGDGWDHSYHQRLRERDEHLVARLTGDLAEDRFVRHPRFGEDGFSYYVPPDGVHDVLVPDGNGSFVLNRPQGTTFRYEATTDPGEHRLHRVSDRFGNYLAFGYSDEDRLDVVEVNSPARRVSLGYDAEERLTSLTDHTGRRIAYTYDDYGDLASVSHPAAPGDPPQVHERYEYEAVGGVRRLVRVLDRAGRLLVENEYDTDELSATFGHVVRQWENHGETSFVYEPMTGFDPDLPEPDMPVLRVWETTRVGQQVEHVFNASGNELRRRQEYVEDRRIREAVTHVRYNADGRAVARINPEGVVTQTLFAREVLAARIGWPDIDPALGEVRIGDRMSFGNLLSTVTRGRSVTAIAPFTTGFWESTEPPATQRDHADDIIVKYRYDEASGLVVSRSDPRHTDSPDPSHVESAAPGEATFDPSDPRFVAHQRLLTRFEYSPGPRYELVRTILPDRTWPGPLDGESGVTGIVAENHEFDTRGRPTRRVDFRGYEWFDAYYDDSVPAIEGLLRRRLAPHLDLTLTADSPPLLEVVRSGGWQGHERFLRSDGADGDTTVDAWGRSLR